MVQPITLSSKSRLYIILATLLALFLSALDTLVMSAAMPTIVAELGGLHLYSWVFSAYLLSRAVALPIFGKLCDLFTNKRLYAISILIFLAGSVAAGFSQTMIQLTLSRVVQGIGAGGNFALVYIVLTDISEPEDRGKMMSLASFVWGLASVLGPTFGGFMVSYASWRWIFFINLPIGGLSLLGILLFLKETREKRTGATIDYWGALTLTITILALLTGFLLGGRDYGWLSPEVTGLFLLTTGAGVAFFHIEKRAREPILSFDFFRVRGFSIGNGSVFLSSFAIFALSAYSPLFIQGAMGKTPFQLGIVMVFLSLGWSVGALLCGRTVNRFGEKPFTLAGALFLIAGCGMTVTFSAATPLTACSVALGLAGIGMGFVSISTLLIVQNSVDTSNLGVSTSSHQFTRTLGGTIGIGICGSIVTSRFAEMTDIFSQPGFGGKIPSEISVQLRQNFENLFRPEIQSLLPPDLQAALYQAMGQSVMGAFWVALLISVACLILSALLPARTGDKP